ncbi:hypothetical protein P153DRAFT_395549 [Dothidotthia symphoricarpi CBS 119687]|uniref:Uncharacterized protein n=1 Tax=Dothidotthia symphoricarpi CBS 119687 TaxID=1392245 RepID=A0A6A6AJ91_9PLEO|nr:uncharacterized protein P153DRAFT_395549 [Dothidotthia symphoricarpi CBS 119687]KAF2131165.1 hypothetical protein P153DRAFT_395549 [Dothidotthia symphoricarpi CBS 119687]
MEDYYSDSSELGDDDDTRPSLLTKLADIPNRTIKYLNYTTNYVPTWGGEEAFRESYQNWRDGMLRSFNLHLSEFSTKYTEDKQKRFILIQAFHPSTNELIGFIHFKYDKEGYSVGGLKLANFKAKLAYNTLGTGATSKAFALNQTGQHGEGMKLSALVFRRGGHNFRIESDDFRWNFIFKKGELACCLKRVSDKTLDKLKKKANVQPRSLNVDPSKDVCVIIGAPGSTRTVDGLKAKGDKVHIDKFKEWLKVTLDIDPPKKMVRTIQGDLIRDPIYQGQMYLHGLLLPSGGMSGRPYGYGYNFVKGHTTRDRESLSGSGEESKGIAAIWAAAIRAKETDDSDLISEYTTMLLKSLNKKGDAMLSIDDNPLPEDIAKRVWQQMLVMNKGLQGRPAFYYSAIEGKDEVPIIEQSLKQNPIPLDLEMWKLLRKFHLCRTPSEELHHRFKSAKVVKVPDNDFAAHMDWMLRCLLHSSVNTSAMKLTFVDGKHLQIDANYFATTWKIHQKWLTHDGSHEKVFCEEMRTDEHDTFLCDHAVLQLWDTMISQLIATGEHDCIAEEKAWLKSLARGRLSQMPRSVECITNDKRGQLVVVWKSVDSHQNKGKPVKVVLHTHDCVGVSRRSPSYMYCMDEEERNCTCPCLYSQAVSEGVTFIDLNPDKEYIPCVSRDAEGAFVALQPGSIQPRSNDVVDVSEPDAPLVLTTAGSNFQKARVEDADDEDDEVTLRPQSLIPDRTPVDKESAAAPTELHSPADSDEDVFDAINCDNDNGSLYEDLASNSPPPTLLSPPSSETDYGVDIAEDRSKSTFQVSHQSMTNPPVGSPRSSRDIVMSERSAPSAAVEAYTLGDHITHNSLDWGGSFPGSHDFFRTRNAPDEDIFILKPKSRLINANGKRVRLDETGYISSKRPRQDVGAGD